MFKAESIWVVSFYLMSVVKNGKHEGKEKYVYANISLSWAYNENENENRSHA